MGYTVWINCGVALAFILLKCGQLQLFLKRPHEERLTARINKRMYLFFFISNLP